MPLSFKSPLLFRAGIVFGVLVLVAGILLYRLRREIPREFMPDIRAGLGARHIKDPDQRLRKYMEGRYGSLTVPANREKAFLDFFNPDHIKALQFMVRHSPEDQRRANILAMARWVESYRNSLTPAEAETLARRFRTEEGRAMLRQATAQYNSQDVQYRGQTAQVISQLLKTIHTVQNR